MTIEFLLFPAILILGFFSRKKGIEQYITREIQDYLVQGTILDKRGNLSIIDQPGYKIYKCNATTGVVLLFLTGTGHSNEIAFDKDGDTCADIHGELCKIHPSLRGKM